MDRARDRGTLRTRARVRRGARVLDVDGEALVPGDLLLLESGVRVPADVRLVEARGLRIDESLLTGESVPVDKQADEELASEAPLAERSNMAFEAFHIGNARSETRSLFRLSPLANPLLLVGTLAALAVHVAALHVPFFQDLLGLAPPAPAEVAPIAGMATAILVVMELHKAWRARRAR